MTWGSVSNRYSRGVAQASPSAEAGKVHHCNVCQRCVGRHEDVVRVAGLVEGYFSKPMESQDWGLEDHCCLIPRELDMIIDSFQGPAAVQRHGILMLLASTCFHRSL